MSKASSPVPAVAAANATDRDAPRGAAVNDHAGLSPTLSLQEIRALAQVIHDYGLTELELTRGEGQHLRLRREQAAPVMPLPYPSPSGPHLGLAAPPTRPPEAPPTREKTNLVAVTSPFVGTFYRAANPDSPPFVEVGQRVRKGQPLCIIEAMKLMNELESDVDGVVVECLAKDGRPVEYGQVLYQIDLG